MGNNMAKETFDSDTLDMTQSTANVKQRGGNNLEYTIQKIVKNSQNNTDASPHFFTDVDFDSVVAIAQNGGGYVDSDTSIQERRYHKNINYKKNRKQNLNSVNNHDLKLLKKQFGSGGEDADKKPVTDTTQKHNEIYTRTKRLPNDISFGPPVPKVKSSSDILVGGSVGQKSLSKNVLSEASETNSQILKSFKKQYELLQKNGLNKMEGGFHAVSTNVLSEASETNSQILKSFKKQHELLRNNSLKTKEMNGGAELKKQQLSLNNLMENKKQEMNKKKFGIESLLQNAKNSLKTSNNLTGGKYSDLAQETSDYGNFSIVESDVLSKTSNETYNKMKGGNKHIMLSDTSIDSTNMLGGGNVYSETSKESIDYNILKKQSLKKKTLSNNLNGGNKSVRSDIMLSDTSINSKNILVGGNLYSETSKESIDYDILKKQSLKKKISTNNLNGGGGCGCTKSGDIVPPSTKLSQIKSGGGKFFTPKKIESIVSSSTNNLIDYNILAGGDKDDINTTETTETTETTQTTETTESTESTESPNTNLSTNSESSSNSTFDTTSNSNSTESTESTDHPINDQADEAGSGESDVPRKNDKTISDSDSTSENNSTDNDAKDTSSDDTNNKNNNNNLKGGLSSSAGITSASEIVINSKFLYSDNTFYGSDNLSDKYNSFSSMIE